MKILFINSVCGIGSTGKIVTDLYDYFQHKGNECCIAYGRGNAPEEYKTYKIGNKFSVYEHVFETRFLDNHGFSSRIATKQLVEFIKEYNPDVIHLHNLHGYYLNIEILFSFLKDYDKKVIWTFHDTWPFSPYSAYDDALQPLSERKKHYPRNFFNLRKNLARKQRAFNGLNKSRTVIVCPSEWLSKLVTESYFCYKSVVINNGIDLEKFSNKRESALDSTPNHNKKLILGCSSVWNEQKGLQYFDELANLIGDEFLIVLIGDTGNLKLNSKINHIEKTNTIDKLADLYSSAYVFYNPTLYDNFPTVNIEALACGCPIVTFGNGGSGEVIDDKVGRIVNNNQEFLKLLNTFDFNKMRNDCIDKSKQYSKKNMAEQYLDIMY